VSFPKVNTPPTVTPFAPMEWLGIPVLSAQTPLTLLALLLVPAIGWLLYRTPAGLALRMVGENPQAAEGQGIPVAATRTAAIVAGSALMGIAGAFFDALQLRLQQSESALLPYQMYLMLPYALSILALVLVARKAAYPQALMKPYRKGER
jgi:ABC-type uncharacterized transport system permease subunit